MVMMTKEICKQTSTIRYRSRPPRSFGSEVRRDSGLAYTQKPCGGGVTGVRAGSTDEPSRCYIYHPAGPTLIDRHHGMH